MKCKAETEEQPGSDEAEGGIDSPSKVTARLAAKEARESADRKAHLESCARTKLREAAKRARRTEEAEEATKREAEEEATKREAEERTCR